MARTTLTLDGSPKTIGVEIRQMGAQFQATIGDTNIDGTVETLSHGGRVLRIGHRIVPFFSCRKGAKIEVWLAGRTYRFDVADARTRKGGAGAGPVTQEISAPMPGTVLRIEVKAGDAFAAHQPLIIMESMKMEMTLSAPHEGRVGQIHCAAGELVSMGKVLVTLEPLKRDADVPA